MNHICKVNNVPKRPTSNQSKFSFSNIKLALLTRIKSFPLKTLVAMNSILWYS